jgi:2-polyprenyl-3-methyl-5-hydroxy-6-metoxy-1,4-benzoquinol methylase
MAFFDFIADLEHYDGLTLPVERLNCRHRFLIDAYRDEIRGARVLDLAAHDGRWCYAFAGAGAESVVGIEGRGELIAKFESYPDADLRARVTLREADIYDGMDAAAAAGETYDVVGVLGILYHVMDHHRLFWSLRKLKPRLIIVDSEFILRPGPIVQLVREKTDNVLNAVASYPGQTVAVKGIPSHKALEVIADTLGYDVTWADWKSLPKDQRTGVGDYFRADRMRRDTCVLRPR